MFIKWQKKPAQFSSHEAKTALSILKPRNRIICCCHLNTISLNSLILQF